MSQIQIRIDQKTKSAAQKILKSLGLDLSSAIKIYLQQVIIQKGIPHPILTENGLTHAQEKAILKASKEAKAGKNVVVTRNLTELKTHLDSLKKKQ